MIEDDRSEDIVRAFLGTLPEGIALRLGAGAVELDNLADGNRSASTPSSMASGRFCDRPEMSERTPTPLRLFCHTLPGSADKQAANQKTHRPDRPQFDLGRVELAVRQRSAAGRNRALFRGSQRRHPGLSRSTMRNADGPEILAARLQRNPDRAFVLVECHEQSDARGAGWRSRLADAREMASTCSRSVLTSWTCSASCRRRRRF